MRFGSGSTDIVYVAGGVLHDRPARAALAVSHQEILHSFPPVTKQFENWLYATAFTLSRVMHPEVNVRVGKCHRVTKPLLGQGFDVRLLLVPVSDPPHTASQSPFVSIDETHRFDPLFQCEDDVLFRKPR